MSARIVNTALYPLDRLESTDGQILLQRVRSNLLQDGSCTLPDFVAADVLQELVGYSTNPAMYGRLQSSILHYGSRVAEIEARQPLYPIES